MLYIPKIDEYLEILTDEEVKNFLVINFSESIKDEQILEKLLNHFIHFEQYLMKYNQILLITIC